MAIGREVREFLNDLAIDRLYPYGIVEVLPQKRIAIVDKVGAVDIGIGRKNFSLLFL